MPSRRTGILSPLHFSLPGIASRTRIALLAVFAITLLARLAFISTLRNEYYFADTAEYRANAIDMLAGVPPNPSTPRAPVFPAFLALGYGLFGLDNFFALRLMQLALSLIMVAVGVWLGFRVGGATTGLLTGLGIALSPTLVFSNGLLYPTTIYTLLLLLLTAGAVVLAERPLLWLGAALGGVLAAGLLTDQVMAAPGAAVVGWLAWRTRRVGRSLALATLVLVVTAGVIAGGYVKSQSSPDTGEAAFLGKAQWTLWWARTDPTMRDDRMIQLPVDGEFHPLPAGAFLSQEWNYLRTRPLAYLHDFGFEFGHFFWPQVDRLQTTNQFTSPGVKLIGAVHFWPVLVLSLLGLVAGIATWRDRSLLMLVAVATAAFYSLFFTQTRYRIPVEPQLTLLAVLGLERLVPGLSRWFGGTGAESGGDGG